MVMPADPSSRLHKSSANRARPVPQYGVFYLFIQSTAKALQRSVSPWLVTDECRSSRRGGRCRAHKRYPVPATVLGLTRRTADQLRFLRSRSPASFMILAI